MTHTIESQNANFRNTKFDSDSIESIREAAFVADEAQRDLEDLVYEAGVTFAKKILSGNGNIISGDALKTLDVADLKPESFVDGMRYVFDLKTH